MEAVAAASPPERLLLGPGPSPVHPRVLEAQARGMIGHLDPWFLEVTDQVASMLRAVFRTSNPLTYAVSGTGSAGMETAVVNVVEPGDTVIVGVNGVFGGRIADTARRAGAEVVALEEPWGRIIPPARIASALGAHPDTKVVAVVHAETSTGALQPLEEIGRLVADTDALLLVDAVTSLGGVPLETDAWGLDVVYSGTQKCLSCPPGLAPLTLSPRALDAVLASTALPGVFPPYEIDGCLYIDGSISDQLPLKLAIDAGAQTVYVMAVSVPSPAPISTTRPSPMASGPRSR